MFSLAHRKHNLIPVLSQSADILQRLLKVTEINISLASKLIVASFSAGSASEKTLFPERECEVKDLMSHF